MQSKAKLILFSVVHVYPILDDLAVLFHVESTRELEVAHNGIGHALIVPFEQVV